MSENAVGGHLDRRRMIGAMAGAGMLAVAAPRMAHAATRLPRSDADPDLGANVIIIDSAMPAAAVQARLDAIFAEQERAHFTDRRYAVLLKPGAHALDIKVGYFTQIAGLGLLPDDVTITGHVHAEADWNDGNALINFWRGVENLHVAPADRADRWAVSQAAPYRRMHLDGDLTLDDGGWASGGFFADCRISGTVRSGTQQQWFTRNSAIGGWDGSNWNMTFVGTTGAPPTSFPEPPYTNIATTPVVRDKPFLHVDDDGGWGVFVPALRRDSTGPGWASGAAPAGRTLPLSDFLIATPATPVATINAALASGRHLLVTPGIYRLSEPIRVTRPDTVVLGLGLATLLAEDGAMALSVADVPGVAIAGLLFDAGPTMSPVLMQVGEPGARGDHRDDPILLADLFFRVGGAAVGNADTCLVINSHHVIGDHLWIWRADHGDRASGRVHVGWSESVGNQGIIVNGDDVTLYGLFVEHFEKYQTIWNGERGRTYFYQNELPYDPPTQASWMAGETRGWAAYKVADDVRHHYAVGMGIYAYFNVGPAIVLESAIEAPDAPDVRFQSVTTISLGNNRGAIAHIVNRAGKTARPGDIRQTLTHYPVQED
ncbi:adenylyl cyclase [Sphingosinithalassobacter portus]|uniref:adenylyl cyclase n=1 Tax=Stakelama portus TaxID=2676234 RepID=UPI001EFEA1EC|nr:adenylyl cyclase [Sphingosinithalassobacter portus]